MTPRRSWTIGREAKKMLVNMELRAKDAVMLVHQERVLGGQLDTQSTLCNDKSFSQAA